MLGPIDWQPYLKIAIYVLKSAKGGLLCRPLYVLSCNGAVSKKTLSCNLPALYAPFLLATSISIANKKYMLKASCQVFFVLFAADF